MRDLPIYDITLGGEDFGIYAISLVENPAIESDFIYMSEEAEEGNQFVFADEDKREILGAILIPDLLIYRKVGGQEFYVKFSKETIETINERMQQTDGNKYFTVEHELGANGTVKFLESWIKETDEDKSNAFGIDVPLGSLIVKAKIESDLLWDMVKTERLKGFSVEIDASTIKAQLIKQQEKGMETTDFTTMYSNSVTTNDTELLFNGELTTGSVMMYVHTEDDSTALRPYEGEFTIDNVEYVVASGLVTSTKDIQLSIEEKLDAVLLAFADLKTELTPAENEGSEEEEGEDLNEKLDTILTKIEEERLARLQGEESEDSEGEAEADTADFSVEDYRAVGEWFSKWN